jgi:hypothetical protein
MRGENSLQSGPVASAKTREKLGIKAQRDIRSSEILRARETRRRERSSDFLKSTKSNFSGQFIGANLGFSKVMDGIKSKSAFCFLWGEMNTIFAGPSHGVFKPI